MTRENIARRNELFGRISQGELLPLNDRLWLQSHPIYSSRYGAPYIIADMIAVEPAKETAITIQCLRMDPQHPIVPTFTIPFEQGGSLRLAAVVQSNTDFRNMRQSTKLSFRMTNHITAVLRCKSDPGVLMVSYQGWVPDNQPLPMWFESVKNNRFAMVKTVVSDNLIRYGCCGSDDLDSNCDDHFNKFQFLVNWNNE